MKIQGNNNIIGRDLTKTNDKASTDAFQSSSNSQLNSLSADSAKINVSQAAKDFQKIREAANKAPDVDQDKVAKFKNLIASGQYEVNASAIADRMVDQELDLAKLEN